MSFQMKNKHFKSVLHSNINYNIFLKKNSEKLWNFFRENFFQYKFRETFSREIFSEIFFSEKKFPGKSNQHKLFQEFNKKKYPISKITQII